MKRRNKIKNRSISNKIILRIIGEERKIMEDFVSQVKHLNGRSSRKKVLQTEEIDKH